MHAWQKRRSWGHIRYISSLGFCQYCITAEEMLVHSFLKDNQAFIIMEFLIEWIHKKIPQYSCHSAGFSLLMKLTLWPGGPRGP